MHIVLHLGTYPIINLLMSNSKTIKGVIVRFQYTLTLGFDFLNPELNLISMRDAVKIMIDKIDIADITQPKLYPKKIDGWLYDKGVYFNSGIIGEF